MGFVEDNFFSEVFSYLIFQNLVPRILIDNFRLNNGPRMPPLIRRPRGLTNAQIGVGVSRYFGAIPYYVAQINPPIIFFWKIERVFFVNTLILG